jgi:uncharacterized membrane protein
METLQEFFAQLTEATVLLIDFMALLIVIYGSLEAFIGAGRAAFVNRRPQYHQIWLRYARWLVAALTFQLAADIIESALAPSWEDIGRLAAIAVIRTFLNYFLGRDLAEVTDEEEHDAVARQADATEASYAERTPP